MVIDFPEEVCDTELFFMSNVSQQSMRNSRSLGFVMSDLLGLYNKLVIDSQVCCHFHTSYLHARIHTLPHTFQEAMGSTILRHDIRLLDRLNAGFDRHELVQVTQANLSDRQQSFNRNDVFRSASQF